MKAKLFILIGPPLSGKTTWRKKKIKELTTFGEIPGYLNRDEIRWDLYGRHYKQNPKSELAVNDELELQAKYLWENEQDVIVDNCNVRLAYINQTIKLFPGYEVYPVFFNVPLWRLYLRNVKRLLTEGRWIPIKVIKKMHADFHKIKNNVRV